MEYLGFKLTTKITCEFYERKEGGFTYNDICEALGCKNLELEECTLPDGTKMNAYFSAEIEDEYNELGTAFLIGTGALPKGSEIYGDVIVLPTDYIAE